MGVAPTYVFTFGGGSHFPALKFSVSPARISATSDLVVVSTFFLLMLHYLFFFLARLPWIMAELQSCHMRITVRNALEFRAMIWLMFMHSRKYV